MPELIIARGVLEARIAMAEGNAAKAAKLFDNAARVQEARLADYWDPPNWWYPVWRSVAAAYLKAGDFADRTTTCRGNQPPSIQRARRDSNPQPSASKADALSN